MIAATAPHRYERVADVRSDADERFEKTTPLAPNWTAPANPKSRSWNPVLKDGTLRPAVVAALHAQVHHRQDSAWPSHLASKERCALNATITCRQRHSLSPCDLVIVDISHALNQSAIASATADERQCSRFVPNYSDSFPATERMGRTRIQPVAIIASLLSTTWLRASRDANFEPGFEIGVLHGVNRHDLQARWSNSRASPLNRSCVIPSSPASRDAIAKVARATVQRISAVFLGEF